MLCQQSASPCQLQVCNCAVPFVNLRAFCRPGPTICRHADYGTSGAPIYLELQRLAVGFQRYHELRHHRLSIYGVQLVRDIVKLL